MTTNEKLEKLVVDRLTNDVKNCFRNRELALGFFRYEALRKLKPLQFEELHNRNLHGENFDGMVDELIIKEYGDHIR